MRKSPRGFPEKSWKPFTSEIETRGWIWIRMGSSSYRLTISTPLPVGNDVSLQFPEINNYISSSFIILFAPSRMSLFPVKKTKKQKQKQKTKTKTKNKNKTKQNKNKKQKQKQKQNKKQNKNKKQKQNKTSFFLK